MDDFLHNLRNPNKKRFDRNKPYDGQYRPTDRFSRDRKNTPQQQQRKPVDNDQLPAIKRLIEGILEQQRRLTELSGRMAEAAERQAEAVESMARYFQRQPSELAHDLVQMAPAEPSAEPQTASDEGAPRQTAEIIIVEQRAMGRSFEQIAQALNSQGIATISGKGQWRAQSVSRLYNTLSPAGPAVPEGPVLQA
jgi:hypothetical protein